MRRLTEEEARHWIADHFGGPAVDRLAQLVAIVTDEANRQNLIAASTIETIWSRHVVDSAQLVALAERDVVPTSWLDIGTGAGFPGLVVATLRNFPVTLVETRKKRADFLERAVAEIGIAANTTVLCSSVESVTQPFDVISARAVAWLGDLFAKSAQCATSRTLWVLPKGRNAREEVASARLAWHGVFHVEQSVTDPVSLIVLASGVSRR